MKKLNKILVNSLVLSIALFGINVYGQDLDAFNDALSQGEATANNVAGTVKNIALVITGLAGIVGLGMVVFGGRDGDDRIKKFGSWLMYLAFFSLGIYLITALFGI